MKRCDFPAVQHFRGCWMLLTGRWGIAAGGFWACATWLASTEWSAFLLAVALCTTSPVLTFGAGFWGVDIGVFVKLGENK